jgi:3-oxoacyl-[acyl-carrier protein] reductase
VNAPTNSLVGRTAIVTGSGAGVGRGIAVALAAEGANVVVTSRTAEAGMAVVDQIKASGGSAAFARVDVASFDDIRGAVATAVEQFGALDIMIHNAVSRRAGTALQIEDIDGELLEEVATTATAASFFCAQAAYEHLKASSGRLILLLAQGGIRGHPDYPVYGIVKGGQRGFLKALAWEWAPDGITVNAVVPVAVTEGMQAWLDRGPENRHRVESRIPLHRIGDPEQDIGRATAFLAGDASGYLTGQTLFVDGGSYFL